MNEMTNFGISTSGLIAQMRPISADSHIVEPPNCYIDRIDPKFLDIAPRVVRDPQKGDIYVIDQMTGAVPMGLIAAAGVDPAKMRIEGARFEDLPRGGWNAKDRIADQDRDGVVAELIYPSVGMMICNHPNYDYKNACFRAYNGWLEEEFLPGAPNRVFGIGQTAARSPAELIEDMRRIKEAGFVGVMLPGFPQVEDYDSLIYDPVWRAAIELDLPLSFHVLTSRSDTTSGLMSGQSRDPKVNSFQSIIRACQDIIGMFIYSGVFERHPELKVVTVEADAGWAPHYMYRMDHAFNRHRHWLDGGTTLTRMPSEYFKENIYMTFQDDWVAFKMTSFFNPRQLLWGNDFPHSDATWPNSQKLLATYAKDMSLEHLKWILHDNTAELYKLSV
jgi:predicted TIM-barrel fold metal-dependent hydrolase